MKILAMAVGLLYILPAMGQETNRKNIQRFFLINQDQKMLEGGFTKVNGELEFENGSDFDVDELNTTVLGQYGFSKQLNIGAEFTRLDREDNSDGMADYEFYARGRLEIYLYELRYFYSHDDRTDDNAVSGGNHFQLSAGVFSDGLGFLGSFQPEYSADVEGSGEIDVGSQTILEVFYEHLGKNNNIWAASAGTWHYDQGDLDDDDLTYGFAKGYATIPFGGFDWLPSVQFFNLLNSNDQVDKSRSAEWTLRVRKVF